MLHRCLAGALVLVALGGGCHRTPIAVEIDNLQPLEDNLAPLPAGGAEALEIVSGGDDDLWWAHGRGYVRAPLEAVWAAALDPDVSVDRREVDEWSIEDDPRDTLDASWRLNVVVHDVITVEFELWWRHEEQDVDSDTPRLVSRWDKTDGTQFIDVLSGSMELIAVPGEPELVEVSVVEHLKASLRDDQTIVAYLRDLHTSLVEAAHGRALPTY